MTSKKQVSTYEVGPSFWHGFSRAHFRAAIPTFAALTIGVIFGIAVLALGGISNVADLAQQHVSGGILNLPDASASKGFVKVEDCNIRLNILQVLHSNLGGQGPDHGEEGIVYKCSEHSNGTYVRNMLVKANARSHYKLEPSLDGKHKDFGFIHVDPDKKVSVRFSIWDMEGNPLTVDLLRVTFYDLDEGRNREYIITDDMHPGAAKDNHTEVREKQVHSGLEAVLASERDSGSDDPIDLTRVMQGQKDMSARLVDHYFDPLEYQDVQHFDTTLGSTSQKTPRTFAFALHSVRACRKVKLAITAAITTASPPPEPLVWIMVVVNAAILVACCGCCMCLACFLKGRGQEDPPNKAKVVEPSAYVPVVEASEIKEPAHDVQAVKESVNCIPMAQDAHAP